MLAPVRSPPSLHHGRVRLTAITWPANLCVAISLFACGGRHKPERIETRLRPDPQPLVAEEPRRKPFIQGYLRSTFGERGGNFSENRLADCYSGGQVSGSSQAGSGSSQGENACLSKSIAMESISVAGISLN
jgi:hypothetical protein